MYDCPDLLVDGASYIYSMTNKCYVILIYPTNIALKNASSYQSFTNILRDYCQGSRDRWYRSKADVSPLSRGMGRQKEFRCYKCNRPGQIQRFCRTPNIGGLVEDDIEIEVSEIKPPTQDNDSMGQGPDVKCER